MVALVNINRLNNADYECFKGVKSLLTITLNQCMAGL